MQKLICVPFAHPQHFTELWNRNHIRVFLKKRCKFWLLIAHGHGLLVMESALSGFSYIQHNGDSAHNQSRRLLEFCTPRVSWSSLQFSFEEASSPDHRQFRRAFLGSSQNSPCLHSASNRFRRTFCFSFYCPFQSVVRQHPSKHPSKGSKIASNLCSRLFWKKF